MDSENLQEELIQLQFRKMEKRRLRINQERMKMDTMTLDHNLTVLGGSLQPLRAGVAPGRHDLLPSITPPPPKKQQQQQQPCSLSSLPACVQGQDPVLMNLLLGDRLPKRSDLHQFGRKNLTGLDFAHPLKPLIYRRAPKTLAPPVTTKGESQNKPKNIRAKRSVKTLQDVCLKSKSSQGNINDSYGDHCCQARVQQDTGCAQKNMNVHRIAEMHREVSVTSEKSHQCNGALTGDVGNVDCLGTSAGNLSPVVPFLKTPTPPTIPSVIGTPATQHKAKPRVHRKFLNRLPRTRKAASLNVATGVVLEEENVKATSLSVATVAVNRGDTDMNELKCEKSVETGKEDVRECKEEEKPQRVVKQTSKPQHSRELPELATLPPVACPEQAILQAFRLLSNDDWEQKVEGLASIRRLSQHHTEVLLPKLHDVCLAVNREVKNLRSLVSRAAMETLAHLFAYLGRAMDSEAEGTAKTLLPKAGEASGFIREDVQLALGYMVLSVTPSRCMRALINTGLRHRNAAVRKMAAQQLEELAKVMGAASILSGKKDLTDRFIHSISCLALDSAQEVRTHARNTLGFLASHPNLVKMVDKFAPQGDRVAVKDIINKCQKSRNV